MFREPALQALDALERALKAQRIRFPGCEVQFDQTLERLRGELLPALMDAPCPRRRALVSAFYDSWIEPLPSTPEVDGPSDRQALAEACRSVLGSLDVLQAWVAFDMACEGERKAGEEGTPPSG